MHDRPQDRRQHERSALDAPAVIHVDRARSVACRTVDVSEGGAKLAVPAHIHLDGSLEVSIPSIPILRRARLAWRTSGHAGLRFL